MPRRTSTASAASAAPQYLPRPHFGLGVLDGLVVLGLYLGFVLASAGADDLLQLLNSCALEIGRPAAISATPAKPSASVSRCQDQVARP
jgi:hypothetical protein